MSQRRVSYSTPAPKFDAPRSAKPKPEQPPHRDRQDATIAATTELLASRPWQEVLTSEEERGLAVALPLLGAWVETSGLGERALNDWSKTDVMRLFAQVVRAAVPLRSLPDHEAFRKFSDEIPW